MLRSIVCPSVTVHANGRDGLVPAVIQIDAIRDPSVRVIGAELDAVSGLLQPSQGRLIGYDDSVVWVSAGNGVVNYLAVVGYKTGNSRLGNWSSFRVQVNKRGTTQLPPQAELIFVIVNGDFRSLPVSIQALTRHLSGEAETRQPCIQCIQVVVSDAWELVACGIVEIQRLSPDKTFDTIASHPGVLVQLASMTQAGSGAHRKHSA